MPQPTSTQYGNQVIILLISIYGLSLNEQAILSIHVVFSLSRAHLRPPVSKLRRGRRGKRGFETQLEQQEAEAELEELKKQLVLHNDLMSQIHNVNSDTALTKSGSDHVPSESISKESMSQADGDVKVPFSILLKRPIERHNDELIKMLSTQLHGEKKVPEESKQSDPLQSMIQSQEGKQPEVKQLELQQSPLLQALSQSVETVNQPSETLSRADGILQQNIQKPHESEQASLQQAMGQQNNQWNMEQNIQQSIQQNTSQQTEQQMNQEQARQQPLYEINQQAATSGSSSQVIDTGMCLSCNLPLADPNYEPFVHPPHFKGFYIRRYDGTKYNPKTDISTSNYGFHVSVLVSYYHGGAIDVTAILAVTMDRLVALKAFSVRWAG